MRWLSLIVAWVITCVGIAATVTDFGSDNQVLGMPGWPVMFLGLALLRIEALERDNR